MKKLSICLLAVFLLTMCGVAYADSVGDRISDLKGRIVYLEGLYVQVVGEIQATLQDAKPAIERAEKIMKLKKDNYTWEEKARINLAAYYEQRIAFLHTLIKLIILERIVMKKELDALTGGKEA